MESFEGLRFASYMRASTNKQDGSRERQERDIREWAEHSGAEVTEWYYDEISGSRLFSKRPAGRLLIDAASDGRIDAVVIESLSRIGRNPLDVILTIGRLTGLGLGDLSKDMDLFNIRIFDLSSRRFIDMNNDSDRLLVWMTAATMDIERSRISARVQSNNKLRKAKGGDVGSPKFGYDWKKNEQGASYHSPDLSKRDIIKSVIDMDARGMTRNEMLASSKDTNHLFEPSDRITRHKVDLIRKYRETYMEDFNITPRK